MKTGHFRNFEETLKGLKEYVAKLERQLESRNDADKWKERCQLANEAKRKIEETRDMYRKAFERAEQELIRTREELDRTKARVEELSMPPAPWSAGYEGRVW